MLKANLLNIPFVAAVAMLFVYQAAAADNEADSTPFSFETLDTLDDMQHFIQTHFSLGSSRDSLREKFVNEGKATLKIHPTQAGVEKYIYDINLCRYYIWRWNISTDYDARGHLSQAYVNGNPVFSSGTQKKDPNVIAKAKSGNKATIFKMKRPRPEATKGERELTFLMVDSDSDLDTIDDQLLVGSGPSRVDPANMGKLVVYQNVEPWRSIFDSDAADRIVPYSGDCAKADELAVQVRHAHP